MRMLFEVMDLEVASPATVSRLGVVYLTPSGLRWMPYVQSCLPKGMPEGSSEKLQDFRVLKNFDLILRPVLKYTRRHCKEPVATQDINIAASLCALLQEMCNSSHKIGLINAEGRVAQKLYWKDIQDVVTVVAAAPPGGGGGRNDVTPCSSF